MVSAGFVHLLGDAVEDLGDTGFPTAPLLCGSGLLLTIIADSVASSFAESSSQSDTRAGDHGLSCGAKYSQVSGGAACKVSGDGPGSPSADDGKPPPVSFITVALLGCALSFHSVLEGAALGAQESASRTADVFVAIAAHKGLAAYALGSSLVESKTTAVRMWSVLTPFAVATPIGIAVGVILSEFSSGRVSAACSALASGTFLYVALMEVIPNELRHKDNLAVKIATLVLGFSLMSLLAKWA
mmetsp:Transcript_42095/g.99800  ORF Transcript_42095/g.99800 Transcript_42095/m.99800 type:complete len:243 (-) Transcript_42095:246-974(-)